MIRICKKCGSRKVKGWKGQYRCLVCAKIYQRNRRKEKLELVRKINREYARRSRKDPAKLDKMKRAAKKCYDGSGLEYSRKRMKRIREEEPFRWKSLLFRKYNPNVTEAVLRRMWRRQKGRCGLTGRKMKVRQAHLDHIVPVSRGGTHKIKNLRWVVKEANYAKHGLLDDEFFELCLDVVRHI